MIKHSIFDTQKGISKPHSQCIDKDRLANLNKSGHFKALPYALYTAMFASLFCGVCPHLMIADAVADDNIESLYDQNPLQIQTQRRVISGTTVQRDGIKSPISQDTPADSHIQHPKIITVNDNTQPTDYLDSETADSHSTRMNNRVNQTNNSNDNLPLETDSIDYPIDKTAMNTQVSTEETIPLRNISPDTLKTFVKVVDLARREYVEPVSDEDLFVNAMQGMLKNLDPYAEFLDSESYEALQAFTQGEVAGIGMTTEYNDSLDQWVITRVKKDSPASLAGIHNGYYLHQIDGIKLNKSTSQHDVNQRLSGMAGSMVDLIISDSGRRKEKRTLQRTESKDTSVNITINHGIAIIKIPVFQENTRRQILDDLVNLNTPIDGIVLDLQDNPGGVLDSAVDIAGLFKSNINVVQIQNRMGERKVLTSTGASHLAEIPVIVLQNRYSASAAEVLASSLQVNNRAKVVGETSYGKGTVQSVIPLDDNYNQAVKLTVAHYLRADGEQIDRLGVIPDIDFNDNDNHNSINHKLNNTQLDSSVLNNQQLGLTISNIDDKTTHPKIFNNQLSENAINLSNIIQTTNAQWQVKAVNLLLEENKQKYQRLQQSRMQKLAKLNQQNRKLKDSKAPPTELLDITNDSPRGILFVYPKNSKITDEVTPVDQSNQ